MELVTSDSISELINLGREKKNHYKQRNIREKHQTVFVEAQFKTRSRA